MSQMVISNALSLKTDDTLMAGHVTQPACPPETHGVYTLAKPSPLGLFLPSSYHQPIYSPCRAPPAPGLPPWPLFSLGTAAGRWAYGLPNSVVPPAPRVLDITFAFAQSQVLYTISKLDIPEALAKGSMTCKELAPLVGKGSKPWQPFPAVWIAVAVLCSELGALIEYLQ
jgi:hypothetical protein